MIKFLSSNRRLSDLPEVMHQLSAAADELQSLMLNDNKCTPHPTPYTLHPTPCTLHFIPCTLHPTSYTLHPTPYTLHPTPCTLHPTPYTLHPTRCILHPTPYTLHPTPYTLHPTPSMSLKYEPSRWRYTRSRARRSTLTTYWSEST